MQPSPMHPIAGLYHPAGYRYYDQPILAYGSVPASTAAGEVADPLGYLAPFVPFQASRLPARSVALEDQGSAALEPGAGVRVRADGSYPHMNRLTLALTAVSVCAIVGLLLSATVVGRQMSLFAEWTEPNTDVPMRLMDMEFRRSRRTVTNETKEGAESNGTANSKMELVPSGNHKVAEDILEATNAAMMPDTEDSADIVETTVAPTTATLPEKRNLSTVSKNGDQPLSDNYEGISRCGRPQFVFCENETSAFYHVAGARGGACLSTKRGHLNICNRSPNGFGSLSDCEHFCVNRNNPQKRCRKPAAFAACGRMDMKRNWWFHDGLSCRQWEYPSGTCPAAESDAFETFQECYNTCAHYAERRWQCHEPSPAACDMVHIRHPFFAVSSGDGAFRCLEASPDNLRGHICLTGGNNFQSLEACKQACLNKPVA